MWFSRLVRLKMSCEKNAPSAYEKAAANFKPVECSKSGLFITLTAMQR